jgi:hypothetical protein
MTKYISNRQQNLKIGIVSYTENETVLEVTGNVGIKTNDTQDYELYVNGDTNIIGDVNVGGASTFVGAITGTISTATKLQNARTFEITGDIVASPISFDGTGNVSLAATIQPNSVELGTDTTGDYVETISGTANQIDVTGGTGESSTPVISFAPNPTIPGNVTIGNDLQVNNNLNVTGNITVGGTQGYILVENFRVSDADIILGFTTDSQGNDVSTDTTANHGGIAIASTEGNPLVNLNIAGIETLPPTYKKIMWFKAGAFAGLNTDAWLSNYAIGIGSTQFPSGTRLAAGSVQFTENDLAVVRNINASGVVTATRFIGTATSLDIDGLPTIADPQSGDFIALYDVSGTVVGKATIQNAALQGVQGTQGLQGTQGTQGLQGLQGLQGTQGTQGLQGTHRVLKVLKVFRVYRDFREGRITRNSRNRRISRYSRYSRSSGSSRSSRNFKVFRELKDFKEPKELQGSQGTQGTQGLQGLQGFKELKVFRDFKEQKDHKELKELKEPKDHKELKVTGNSQGTQGLQGTEGSQGTQGTQGTHRELKVFRDFKEPKDHRELKVLQGTEGSQGTQGLQGLQGTKEGSQGTQGLQGLQGTEGSQGTQLKELKEPKDRRELKVFKDFKEQKDHREHRVLKELKGRREHRVLKELKVFRVLKEHKDL